DDCRRTYKIKNSISKKLPGHCWLARLARSSRIHYPSRRGHFPSPPTTSYSGHQSVERPTRWVEHFLRAFSLVPGAYRFDRAVGAQEVSMCRYRVCSACLDHFQRLDPLEGENR